MKIITKTITEGVIGNIEVPDRYNFDSELVINETLSEKEESAYFRQLYTDGLIVLDVFSGFDIRVDNFLSLEESLIVLVFHLEGNSSLMDIDLQKQTHNVEIINPKEGHIVFEQSEFTDSFIVLLSKEFYLRLIPVETSMHRHLADALKNNLKTSLSKEYLPVNQEMRRIIDNVRHCTRKGSFHRFCLELKITELMMLQFEQFHLFVSEPREKLQPNIYDQKKLNKAKKILDENFHNPPTITGLSSMVGLNESKLKADFKQVFNSTIHSYTLKLRMETAYKLITESEKQLKEVAVTVGYQNASHFSAAFKSFYGFSPSVVKLSV